jgi:hypothetical protein
LSDNGKYLVYINQENILTVFDTDVKEMIQEIQLDEELLICQCLFKPNSLEIAIGSSSDVTFVTFFPSEDTHHSFSKRHIQEEQKTSTTQLSFTMCLTQETLVLYRDDNKNDHKMQLWEGHRYEGLTEISCPYLLQPVVCGLRSSLNHFAVLGTFYIYFFAHSYNMVVLTWRPNPNEMIDILSFNSSPFQSPFHSTSSSSDTQTIHPSIVYHDKDILPTTIEKYQWKKIKEPIPVMDWISGEETPLLEHMKSEEDSFYFWIPNMLCLAFTKDKMEELKKDFSNIKYECKKVDTTLVPRLENIKKKNPFLALRSLGFFGGLLPLNEIKSAYKSKHRLFHLSKTEKRCLTITSLQMLTSNPQAVSADHCQIGKDDFVYTLKYIPDHYLIRNVTKSKKKRTKPKSVTKTKRETKKSIK